MGKIIMPKNSALLNEVEAVLKIYYEENDWLSNDIYKERLKNIIGDGQYSSSYTKKAQITSYFGFTVWEDIHNSQSRRQITPLGRKMYQAVKNKKTDEIQAVLMDSLERTKFGRDNYGCPDSDSDIEPPALFIRASIDLGYLTYREFAYLLWKLEDLGANYTDSLRELRKMRSSGNIDIGDEAKKYTDCKPIMVLVRWGFLSEDETDSSGGKHIIVNEDVRKRFIHRLKNLKIYNVDMNFGDDTQASNSNNIDTLTPEWFETKAKDFPDYDRKGNELREKFLKKYGVDRIEHLRGKELLTTIFLNNENRDNLCYELEFSSDNREYFGSIKSGTAYKYGLHYSQKNNTWASGTGKNPNFLSEDTAIEVGTQIRDNLIAGAKIIEQIRELNSLQAYLDLYEKLLVATDGYINKVWFAKYYQMLRPDLFPPIYSHNAQQTVCLAINEKPNDNVLCRMAQIRFFANKCNISNILFSKVFWTYATGIIENDEVGEDNMSDEAKQVCTYDSEKCVDYINLIVYGTPGCGKSYYVKNTLLKDYRQENIIRTTFYQDYTNTDFVGQILPTVSGSDVTYKFNPGPFTLALERAIKFPNEPVALVIEELNRGNAASIFGDIFQLLDRENGKSEYQITNVNIQKYLSDNIDDKLFEYIMLPANLTIVATMNTSDQNVFTLDTAFKRRWDFKKLKNKFEGDHPYKDYYVPGMMNITWEAFVNSINSYIVSASSDLQSEDKQLGVFFVSEELLRKTETAEEREKTEKFAYKVLEYLWDDVAKFDRDTWFNDKIKSLDELVEMYVTSGKEVFKDGIFKQQNS